MVNDLLETYSTDDIIAGMDIEMSGPVKLSNNSSLELSNELCLQPLRCTHAIDEYVLKGVFGERLRQSIRRSMREYWNNHETEALQKLANHDKLWQNYSRCTPKDQPAIQTRDWHNWNSHQSNRCRESIKCIELSNNTSGRSSYSGKELNSPLWMILVFRQ